MWKKIINIILFVLSLGITSFAIFLNRSSNKEFLQAKGRGETTTPRGFFTLEGGKEREGILLTLSWNLWQATLDITNNSWTITTVLSKFEANTLLYDYKSQKIQSMINNHVNKSIAINDILEKSYKEIISTRYGDKLYLSGSLETSPLLWKHNIGYRWGVQSYCMPYLDTNWIGRYCLVYGHLDITMNDNILERSTIQWHIQRF